jgi:hypothetical protein
MFKKVKYEIQYEFVGNGSVVSPYSENEKLKPKNNRIFLDIGNDCDFEQGIIDHHHFKDTDSEVSGEYRSVAGICYSNRDKILKFIDKIEGSKVEIVVHTDPDLDCVAAAYIIEKYLNNEELSSNFKLIVDYSEEVNSGRMRIDKNNLICLVSVFTALGERCKHEKNTNIRYKQVLENGIDLIDYVVNKLDKQPLHNKDLYNASLFEASEEYSGEIRLIKEDYIKYKSDLSNENICTKLKMKLPLVDSSKVKLKEVDALFWNVIPSCLLHKYWARQDETSPKGTGYTFTFIPSEVDEKTIERAEKMKLTVYKAIISVDPRSEVCLKGLGICLEEAEKEKETRLFGRNIEVWRSRKRARFPEDWCDNEDPWYDGRNFNYTIVDAPREGSLLTIKEMQHIAINFAAPLVSENRIKYIIPFSFDEEKYSEICKEFGSNTKKTQRRILIGKDNDVLENSCSIPDLKDYFSTYIENYLFGFDKDEVKCSCCEYKVKGKYVLEADTRQRNMKIMGFDSIFEIPGKTFGLVEEYNIIFFKYGIGLLYFDLKTDLKIGLPGADELLEFNQQVYLNSNNIFERYIRDLEVKADLKADAQNTKIFASIRLFSRTVFKLKNKEILYKLTNFMNYEGESCNSRYLNLENGDGVEANKNLLYSFTKNGTVLLTVVEESDIKDYSKQKSLNRVLEKNDIIRQFHNIDFYIFVLALHQRNCLLKFTNMLSQYDSKRNNKKIEKLRLTFLNFVTQSWFSQITNDNVGSEFYKRWMEVFENKALYEEVSGQLSAVDDYNKSSFSSKFTLISAGTFPIVILATIASLYSPGYMKNSGDIFGLFWSATNGEVPGALSVGWGWPVIIWIVLIFIAAVLFGRKK